MVIADRHDRQCDGPDGLAVEVCQCDNRDTCAAPQPGPRYGDPPSGRLGPAAIGLLLLGLLMLLREYPHPSCCPPPPGAMHAGDAEGTPPNSHRQSRGERHSWEEPAVFPVSGSLAHNLYSHPTPQVGEVGRNLHTVIHGRREHPALTLDIEKTAGD